jgi:hypothetical protein
MADSKQARLLDFVAPRTAAAFPPLSRGGMGAGVGWRPVSDTPLVPPSQRAERAIHRRLPAAQLEQDAPQRSAQLGRGAESLLGLFFEAALDDRVEGLGYLRVTTGNRGDN